MVWENNGASGGIVRVNDGASGGIIYTAEDFKWDAVGVHCLKLSVISDPGRVS